ncbi:MAG: hypothetical protein LC667_01805 [Thioalkalivibrio sp.]|nr:hypothetical protein [Thioalkalivibrio sp.]
MRFELGVVRGALRVTTVSAIEGGPRRLLDAEQPFVLFENIVEVLAVSQCAEIGGLRAKRASANYAACV